MSEEGVVNVARYYYYETVRINGQNNNIYNIFLVERDLLAILMDYGKPLYKASSWAVMLTVLEGGIKGYKSLYTRASNLIINEEDDNPSWLREGPLGARGKTGIRAFIAIRVLFWIYIYYNGPNRKGNVNSIDMEELAKIKKGEVDDKGDFLKGVGDNFLPLRKVVFLGGGRRKGNNKKLPS
ncbi:hypothetical protein V2W45_1464008 [Cenococcum geophilum]